MISISRAIENQLMYKQISICINHIEERQAIVKFVLQLAEIIGAKLVAYYLKTDVSEVRRWQMNVPVQYANKLLLDIEEIEERAHFYFDKLAEEYDVETKWLTINKSNTFFNDILCTDLIIADQPDLSLKSFNGDQSFLNNLIVQTKRPVLMVPKGSEASHIGKNIVVGWNASAESMRAIQDAIPFLTSAEKVLCLQVIAGEATDESHPKSFYEVQHYLNQQDIKHHFFIDHNENEDIPQRFLERANTFETDLLVIGGYGHSRWRELVMGGMTKYLIKHSNLPILFSH